MRPHVEGRLRVHLAMDCYRTKKQTDPSTYFANISKERNMFVDEHFLAGIVREYGKHVSSFYRWRWYMVPNGL